MKSSLLAPSLEIKYSKLYVKNVEIVSHFYQNLVGLDLIKQTKLKATFGYRDIPIIELESKSDYPLPPRQSAGLYHNAIVFSSRSDLAATISRIITQAPELYEGSADHLVSEAFYFHDPELNGLELYFDRPRDVWQWENGYIKMDTIYLDPEQYIADHIKTKSKDVKRLGHVHLKVGDIVQARKFYVDILGFDITFEMGSALFISVGGYHHHLGMNTWMSLGAGRREPTLGLSKINLVLPEKKYLTKLADRLKKNNIDLDFSNQKIKVTDPWGNNLLFSS